MLRSAWATTPLMSFLCNVRLPFSLCLSLRSLVAECPRWAEPVDFAPFVATVAIYETQFLKNIFIYMPDCVFGKVFVEASNLFAFSYIMKWNGKKKTNQSVQKCWMPRGTFAYKSPACIITWAFPSLNFITRSKKWANKRLCYCPLKCI